MGTPIRVRNIRDSYVAEGRPGRNFSSLARLNLNASAANTRYAYLFFGKPYPLGATIMSAKLRVYNAHEWAGSVTLTAERITSKWGANKVTWNNKPTVGGPVYSVTKSNAPADTMWEIDITPMIQLISNGGAWYGIRLKTNVATLLRLHSAQSNESARRPEVEIQWSDRPDAPEELSPSGNRAVSLAYPTLSWDFTDVSGDTDLVACQVQLNSTDSWAAPQYDTGEVAVSEPELDLSVAPWINAAPFPGLTNGQSIWWRVRNKDGAGLWSSWSDAEQFRRSNKGVLTLVNPPADDPATTGVNEAYIEDVTPPVVWSLTGANQRAYQLIVTHPDDPGDWIWTTGKITSATTTTIDIPAKVIKNVNRTYRFILRVWDDVDREKTPGDPIFHSVVRDVLHRVDATVDPVTNLAMQQAHPWPWVDLTWDRGTMPDEFTILRDGDVIDANVNAVELSTGGLTYKYRDRAVSPRENHTWEVMAVVNRKNSAKRSVIGQTRPNMTWMMRLDTSDPICILKSGSEPGPVVDASLASFQELHQPVGGGSPVLISQYVGGYEGHVEGVLADNIAAGLTAREMRNRFKRFKRQPGVKLLLYMVDETLEVVAYNMNYRPRAKSGGVVLYDISFDFFEAD